MHEGCDDSNTENMLDKFHSRLSYSATGLSSMIVNQNYALKNVYLSRNTQDKDMNQLIDEGVVTRGPKDSNPVFPLGSIFVIC